MGVFSYGKCDQITPDHIGKLWKPILKTQYLQLLNWSWIPYPLARKNAQLHHMNYVYSMCVCMHACWMIMNRNDKRKRDQNISNLGTVFYQEGACRWVGVCQLSGWFFVYLAVPPAHLWECCYLAWGLEGLSIFNGVQTLPSCWFKHHFIHLQGSSSFIHCVP